MDEYVLTIFDPAGKKLIDKSFEAQNSQEAARIGKKLLEGKRGSNYTHRCVSPDGRLILFHS